MQEMVYNISWCKDQLNAYYSSESLCFKYTVND
jgi:hypothetical protein